MLWRCSDGRCLLVLPAVASTGSLTVSRRSPPKRANSPHPENGQRLAGYVGRPDKWPISFRSPENGVLGSRRSGAPGSLERVTPSPKEGAPRLRSRSRTPWNLERWIRNEKRPFRLLRLMTHYPLFLSSARHTAALRLGPPLLTAYAPGWLSIEKRYWHLIRNEELRSKRDTPTCRDGPAKAEGPNQA